LSAAPPVNGPLWSLSYEFWYYVIFGLFLHIRKNLKISLLAVIACIIAGPKILLMMPIWLAGCLVYALPKPELKKSISWLFVILCLISAGFVSAYTTSFPYQLGKVPFYYSNQFVTDWAIGLFIALSIWFLPEGADYNVQSKFITKFRKIADLTFPIYVLHYPILILYRALTNYQMYDTMQMLQAFTVVLLSTVLLGLLLDLQRFVWRRFFTSLFQFKKNFFKINLSFFSGKSI
jgi:peptidoglycan/LPS O-acetylase OafA/YrhL